MTMLLQAAADTTSIQGAATSASPLLRIAFILALAAVLHLLVLGLRRAGEWIVTPDSSPEIARDLFVRRHPKLATITTLVVSAAAFIIYFVAFGLVFRELQWFDVRTYFASATVIGLAVGFGSQGLVQDVVIGLTLIFSNAFNVGDIVEISGQVGRVEKLGLRFTTLINFVGQTVYVPNRNIGLIGRFRRGAVRAFVDVQLSERVPDDEVMTAVDRVARGLRSQHPAVFITDPELQGPFSADPGEWRYVRVKFRIWPGQGSFIEGAFRQRVLATLRRLDPDYADWMVTIAYRVTR
ncbi:MAG TPA: mechanosensitive ion channel domain-containing protein [Longimicrobiales bacterium]|nr:mechanosensitive ion channel domain-containing protein [Longimicrobiales bacterium]